MHQKLLCHRAEVAKDFWCCNYRLCFQQCDWQLENSPQKANNVNEAKESPEHQQNLSSQVGSGHETISVCVCEYSTHVSLTGTCWVHSNVCGLIITLFIRYHTVVNSILSTSPPVQKYHHLTSCSVEVPLLTTARNSSSIGKEPVPSGWRSTTRSIVSHTAQGIFIFTNVVRSHETVVIECCTFECEPNRTCTREEENQCLNVC